jgi:hypothetical protein
MTIGASASELKTGCCSQNNVFLKMFRPTDQYLGFSEGTQIPKNAWIMVHETEHYLGNLNPKYRQFEITGARLCKNNTAAPLKIEVFDFSQDNFHKLLGSGFASIKDLMGGQPHMQTGGGRISFYNFSCMPVLSILDLVS